MRKTSWNRSYRGWQEGVGDTGAEVTCGLIAVPAAPPRLILDGYNDQGNSQGQSGGVLPDAMIQPIRTKVPIISVSKFQL